MHQEQHGLNGVASLYLMIGAMQSDVKHLASGLHVLSGKVAQLEQQSSWRLPFKDLGGFLFAAAILILAVAGKWALIGELVHGYGR